MRFDHFGNGFQRVHDVDQMALGNLDGRERQHAIPHATKIELGAEPRNDAALDQLVEPGLGGSTRNTESAGQLDDCNARLVCQFAQ